MAKTFEDMINEDFGDLVGKLGGAIKSKVNNYKDTLMAQLGSAEHQGKLDLADTLAVLQHNWSYYQGQQQLQPSLMSLVDFVKTTLGWNLDEDTAYRAIYGNNPQIAIPKDQSPNSVMIGRIMKKLINNQVPQDKLMAFANQLAQYAKSDEADEVVVSKWLIVLANKNPQVMKMREMSILSNYAHGGLLSPQLITDFLTGVAKIILKKHLASQNGGAQPATPQAPANGAPEATADATPTDPANASQNAPTASITLPAQSKPIASIAQIKKEFGKYLPLIAKAEQEASQDANFVKDFVNSAHGTSQIIDEMSSIYFQYFGKANPAEIIPAFKSLTFFPSKLLNDILKLVKMGGDISQVSTALNVITQNNLKRSNAILGTLIAFKVAKAMQQQKKVAP